MSTHMYSYTATEPQYVSTRIPNQGELYINSQDAPPGTDRTNYTVGTSEILATAMARIKVLGFATYWNVPNVNPRNNVLSFYISTGGGGPPGGTKFTVTLDTRWYNIFSAGGADEAALILDIITKMNAVVPVTVPVTQFRATAIPGFPQTYTLDFTPASPAGLTFSIDPTCLAVTKGAQMFNFPVESPTNLTASKQLGTMNFVYTQFIDIISSTLTKWDKMQSASTGRISPLIIRAYAGGQAWGLQFQDVSNNPIELSWKADEPLASFDIRFFDMNGDPLYQPNGGTQWIWQLTLLAEM